MIFYGTLGPACREENTIKALFRAGMNGMRLNLSHGSLSGQAALLESYYRAASACGVDSPALVIDLQGPELRVGTLSAPLNLETGTAVQVCPSSRCPAGAVPLPAIAVNALRPGQLLNLDDSALCLAAEQPLPGGWLCRVERGGVLKSRKSVALPGLTLPTPALTDADRANLALARQYGVTAVLQPFVRGREDLQAVRQALEENGLQGVKLIAKIENSEGVEHLDEIIAGCDEVCIARGDLGNGMPLWELPRLQKQISARCRRAGREFMVVTQLLHSMESRPVPTRAEVSDIYNAVLDGAASLMLTGETAAGQYPVQAMEFLVKTARTAL